MALTYAQMATLAANANFKLKVKAAIADVSVTQIRALPNNAPNRVQLINLSVRLMEDASLLDAVCQVVASSAPNSVNGLATPAEDTLPDSGAGSIKALVRNAMDALVTI